MTALDTTGPDAGLTEPDATGTPDTGWRRLSPRMLAVHPIQELIRALPALAGILFVSEKRGDNGPLWTLAALVVVVGLGLLRWITTTYRVGAEQVQIRRGLLRRSVISVRRDRVRSVDITSAWMHRLLGLASLTVGTGTSDRRGSGGLKLDSLSVTEAHRLRDELLQPRRASTPAPNPAVGPAPATGRSPEPTGVPAPPVAVPAATVPDEVVPAEVVLARLSPAWLRYGPFTLSGIVTVAVVTAFGSQFLSTAHLDPTRTGAIQAVLHQLRTAPLALAIVEVVLAVAVVVGAFSTLGYALAFWNFRLTRRAGAALHVTRGLVTTRSTSAELSRLRGVELSEPLLLRLVRGARCIAITTGLRVGRGAERGGSLLLPPAPLAEAQRVAGDVLGRAEPVRAALAAHGSVARRRRYTRALLGAAVLVALVALVGWLAGWPDAVWQASLVLLPLSVPLAADRYRSLGHALVGSDLVIRQGSLVRRRCVLSTEGIIGWNLRRSFWQRRGGLVSLTATTAAGRQRYLVRDLPLATGLALAEQSRPGLLSPFLRSGPSTER